MDDRTIMENLLLTTKGACDLYMHGTIESDSANVHSAFEDALTGTLDMQSGIYKQMMQHGWYTAEQVQQQKIDQVKSKYTNAN